MTIHAATSLFTPRNKHSDRKAINDFLAFLLVITCLTNFVRADEVSAFDQASEILKAADVGGGMVIHLGCGDGKLTNALGCGGKFTVQGRQSQIVMPLQPCFEAFGPPIDFIPKESPVSEPDGMFIKLAVFFVILHDGYHFRVVFPEFFQTFFQSK